MGIFFALIVGVIFGAVGMALMCMSRYAEFRIMLNKYSEGNKEIFELMRCMLDGASIKESRVLRRIEDVFNVIKRLRFEHEEMERGS